MRDFREDSSVSFRFFFWYDTFHYHGYGHLWFLLYLFVFSLFCVPLFGWWQRDESRIERIGAFLAKGNRLLLPIALIILLELGLRPFFHPDAYIIFGDWANVTVYLSLFIFGYVYAAPQMIESRERQTSISNLPWYLARCLWPRFTM